MLGIRSPVHKQQLHTPCQQSMQTQILQHSHPHLLHQICLQGQQVLQVSLVGVCSKYSQIYLLSRSKFLANFLITLPVAKVKWYHKNIWYHIWYYHDIIYDVVYCMYDIIYNYMISYLLGQYHIWYHIWYQYKNHDIIYDIMSCQFLAPPWYHTKSMMSYMISYKRVWYHIWYHTIWQKTTILPVSWANYHGYYPW